MRLLGRATSMSRLDRKDCIDHLTDAQSALRDIYTARQQLSELRETLRAADKLLMDIEWLVIDKHANTFKNAREADHAKS